jgi:hypothetical protein
MTSPFLLALELIMPEGINKLRLPGPPVVTCFCKKMRAIDETRADNFKDMDGVGVDKLVPWDGTMVQ